MQSLDGAFREIPVRGVERVAVVDHLSDESGPRRRRPGREVSRPRPQQRAIENRLAPVRVSGPFVEHQDGAKFAQGDHAREQGIREIVVNRGARGISGISRAEVPARLRRDS